MKPLRLLVAIMASVGGLPAQRVGAPTDDLEKLSVDELFQVQVTSVGRKAQRMSTAPAAVFVLTADEIRRSGASSIPEALRWVPGLTVLSMDDRSWAISARGGNRLYVDKILVMIDGRSLYTPLFSGALWEVIDLPLEDIEQIEVVRGPGAVMWGPNAVNGVINIITKKAKSTRGGTASVAAGNDHGSLTARWGGGDGDRLSYRVWGKLDYLTPAFGSPGYYNYNGANHTGPPVNDLDSADGRFGFNFEGRPGERDQVRVQGDIYKAGRHDPVANPLQGPNWDGRSAHSSFSGGYLQALWTHTSLGGAETGLQLTYSPTRLHYPFEGGDFNNLTVDFQYRRQAGERNEIYWGAGFQQYQDNTSASPEVRFDPQRGGYRAGDVVLRDELQIVPGLLMGSAGVRIDYNSYRQVEYQPSLRLLYTPNARQSAWVAASRAVKAPDRLDRDLRVMEVVTEPGFPFPLNVAFSGSTLMRSETERSLEAGYRRQSGQRWSVDASVFYSEYSRLRASYTSPLPTFTPTGILLDRTINNSGAGRNWGGEIWGTWQVRTGWRLLPGYSYLREEAWLPPGPLYSWDHDPSDLRNQGTLRSQHDLTRNLQLDLMARTRSRDLAYGLPGAAFFDARLAWRPHHAGEVSVFVENIADRRAVEVYAETGYRSIPTRRTFVMKWTGRF